MGIFNQKSKFKAAPPTIRKEEVVIERPKPKPRPVVVSSASGLQVPMTAARKIKTPSASPRASPGLRQSASPYPPSSDEKRPDLKRKIRNGASHRPSPASDRIEFDKDDSESDDDWEDALDARKRRKRALMMNTEARDPDRKMPHPDLLGIANEDKIRKKEMQLVHAVDVASLKLKCSPTLNAPPEEVALKLQYPGSKQRERYELVAGREKIDVVKEIITVVKYVADVYLDDDEAKPLTNRENGIIRRLERASSTAVWDYKAFKSAVSDFNDRLLMLYSDGTIAKNLKKTHDLPPDLVAFILNQIYERTVSQSVELLRKYENGTDFVYGELKHVFITDLLVRRLKMTSSQVFVDLGSGVGNVALQAALEIGCESWGCEIMENACNLAVAQKKEFTSRCRLWGLAPGKVRLLRGDFTQDTQVHEALKRADVVLVNNQAFTSKLNDTLVTMFLDLKQGCKIISLRNLVHDSGHNINDVGTTILDVEHHRYPEGYVSWTDSPGTFCISTRK